MRVETKYSVGDKVWWAGTRGGEKRTTCPDCLGQKTWHCTTPAGEEFDVPCSTCEYGHEGSLGYLVSYCTDPLVQCMTIGSVQIDTYRDEIRYMCRETGVGSGALHSEDRLFATEEEASAAAGRLAAGLEQEIAERNSRRSVEAKRKRVRRPRKQ